MKKVRLNGKSIAENHLKICVLCVTNGLNYEWDQKALATMMDTLESSRMDLGADEWDFEFGHANSQCKGCAFMAEHTALTFAEKLVEKEDT